MLLYSLWFKHLIHFYVSKICIKVQNFTEQVADLHLNMCE